ncbi:Non-reducing end beta-L-arabinofuranosidase [Dyadobacter sp. CECT 9275]|uniref:Non-reducing end beta-L-arabinofuranosidase n=1 Tax=Dyadobacter helix TaxID=2822344 RepID=A0A916JFM5_9BACT|nr:beta-L-arabinofuranosidase domain-containing protein [Dyadobacter sp. CECT 9275]CAG5003557.1 Non-reducing end beta-L-arabinofuranosidase [Dyadobacter sp. CECT 9275]
MKKSFAILSLWIYLHPVLGQQSSITAVPLKDVRTLPGFWHQRVETARNVTIPHVLKKCQETGRFDNFAVAGGLKTGTFQGARFDDSDVFKVVEGASYSLQNHYDAKLDQYLDSLITLFAAAQEPDGYLYTIRTIHKDTTGSFDWIAGPYRYSFENGSHELYNVGHLYEAAVAHYQATGKKNLLNIAIKNADHLVRTFGPAPGQLVVVPGHEETELALIKLYGVTSKREYLDLAKFFVDMRGRSDKRPLFLDAHQLGPDYFQDQIPFVRQRKAVGHAVRAQYLYAAVADLIRVEDNPGYGIALDSIWQDATFRKQYITGGVGAREDGEAFDQPYILPNDNAYAETCAAIANVFWNHRMFLITGQAKYMDVFERVLYNGLLGGMGIKGDKFFYVNPMSSNGVNDFGKGSAAVRHDWFGTACCPTNISRFIPALPEYIYARNKNQLLINLFAASEVRFKAGDVDVKLSQETNYPWDGAVRINVSPEKTTRFPVGIRIPGWASGTAIPGDLYEYQNKQPAHIRLSVNKKAEKAVVQNGYITLDRNWKKGDIIEISLDMPVRTVVSNSRVNANAGMVAIERGPVLYCAEGHDNQGKAMNISVSKSQIFSPVFQQDMLSGISVLKSSEGNLTLIPYYAWANRGATEMTVWFKEE